MKIRYLIPVLASVALAAPAFAQDSATPPGKELMLKHRGEMCTNLYAHAVGKLASLEVQLKLTASQKPLFERWKSVRLERAKAHSAKCADMKMPGPDMSIMEGVKLETAMLEARLADLKAETPALEALVNALDKDQQETLQRAALRGAHERLGMARRFLDRHDRPMHRRMMDGDMPPPPAH